VPTIDLELPVDPNEPTYCLCNQVSYGEMVACDNSDVRNIGPLYFSLMFSPSLVSDHYGIHLAVQDRVVSFWMRGRERATQGEMVLPKLHWVPEEAKRQMIFLSLCVLGGRTWLLNVVDDGRACGHGPLKS
jgi:hypothetical protein